MSRDDAWVETARQRLAPVLDGAARLGVALAAGTDWPPGPAPDPADDLLARCEELSRWLETSRAPRGSGRARAELHAVCGVLRNAAYAFQHRATDSEEQSDARRQACRSMLEQADEHVRRFTAIT